jgi:hypothetical protein
VYWLCYSNGSFISSFRSSRVEGHIPSVLVNVSVFWEGLLCKAEYVEARERWTFGLATGVGGNVANNVHNS